MNLTTKRELSRYARRVALLAPALLLVIGQCLLNIIWADDQPLAVIAQGTLAVLSCALIWRCALRWDPVSLNPRADLPINVDAVTTVAIVSALPEQLYDKESDEFIAIASHDLRAPMRAVLSLAQWILADDPGVTAKTAERLQLIEKRIQRMGRLLDAVQRYARLSRPMVPSGPTLTASDLGEHIAATIRSERRATGARIHLDVSTKSVLVTQEPLDEVLRHLIDNAIKHHDLPQSNIALAVSDSGNYWRFTVTDDGPGIPEQHRRTVFEQFKALKPRDDVEGSGMGLAIVRRIVRQFGGECGVDAVADHGSEFWFDWPKLAPAASTTGRTAVSDA